MFVTDNDYHSSVRSMFCRTFKIRNHFCGVIYTEEGSIDIEEFEQNGAAPGAMLVYRQGTKPPTPIPNGNLPSEIMKERYNLKSDMEYVAGVSQLMMNGATPAGVTSGTAIQNLVDIDNTRLSLTGDHITF